MGRNVQPPVVPCSAILAAVRQHLDFVADKLAAAEDEGWDDVAQQCNEQLEELGAARQQLQNLLVPDRELLDSKRCLVEPRKQELAWRVMSSLPAG